MSDLVGNPEDHRDAAHFIKIKAVGVRHGILLFS